jgi:hypothetical protein
LVTGSMVSGFAPRWARGRRKSAAACARDSSPARPGARSRLHGRGQRVIPVRFSQGRAALSPAHGTVAVVSLLLPLPPSSGSSSFFPGAQLLLPGDSSCGRAGPRPQTPTPGLGSARGSRGPRPPALLQRRAIGWPPLLPGAPRSPGSLLGVRWRPEPSRLRVPPPAPPPGLPWRGGAQSVRARLAKFLLPASLPE